MQLREAPSENNPDFRDILGKKNEKKQKRRLNGPP